MTTATAKKTELTPVTPSANALANMPADFLSDAEMYAGAGASNDASDQLIPFLAILQDMSPQVKKRDPAYIEGAEPGMIMHTALKRIIPGEEGVLFQPCFFSKLWVEWVPRKAGGGFRGQHAERPEDAREIQDTGEDGNVRTVWRRPNGNDVIETRYHFGHIVEEDGSFSPAVIAFSSTGHTASRQWMTIINSKKLPRADGSYFVAPSWFSQYRLTTVEKSKASQTWFSWNPQEAGWIQAKALRDAGKALHDSIASGAVRAAEPETVAKSDEDIPI